MTDIVPHRGRLVFIFDADDDLGEIYDAVDAARAGGTTGFVFVPLDGTVDENLDPSQYLTENYNASLINSLMWDGLFTEEEQDKRIWELIDNFIDTGKQYLVEEYEFNEDEPFYDYSGGRDGL